MNNQNNGGFQITLQHIEIGQCGRDVKILKPRKGSHTQHAAPQGIQGILMVSHAMSNSTFGRQVSDGTFLNPSSTQKCSEENDIAKVHKAGKI